MELRIFKKNIVGGGPWGDGLDPDPFETPIIEIKNIKKQSPRGVLGPWVERVPAQEPFEVSTFGAYYI